MEKLAGVKIRKAEFVCCVVFPMFVTVYVYEMLSPALTIASVFKVPENFHLKFSPAPKALCEVGMPRIMVAHKATQISKLRPIFMTVMVDRLSDLLFKKPLSTA